MLIINAGTPIHVSWLTLFSATPEGKWVSLLGLINHLGLTLHTSILAFSLGQGDNVFGPWRMLLSLSRIWEGQSVLASGGHEEM